MRAPSLPLFKTHNQNTGGDTANNAIGRHRQTITNNGDCNIPREYYLKINNKRNKFINSHLGKNPNAGKFQFIKIARQNS